MTKRTAYTVSIATLFMSACATHPIPDDVTRDSTLNIVKKIRCEARKAIEEHDPKRVFDAIEIAYNFKFTITENNNAGGSAIFSLPFTNGTFTLGIGAGEDRQRSGERNLLMAETFKDLRGEDCRVQADRENWKYPITGTVGLKETIGTFVGLLQLNLLDPQGEKLDSFVDSLEFTTTIKANVEPKIVLSPISSSFRLTEAKGTLVADRTDKHKVVIALDLPTPPKVAAVNGKKPTAAASPRVGNRALMNLRLYNDESNRQKILDILKTAPVR